MSEISIVLLFHLDSDPPTAGITSAVAVLTDSNWPHPRRWVPADLWLH
jgi:hypothetical protein